MSMERLKSDTTALYKISDSTELDRTSSTNKYLCN